MIVLGIETATALCGAALSSDDDLLASSRLIQGHAHAERLPGAINRVLKESGYEAGQIDGIAVSAGPGSFTGLRIGMGVAKGMALALDKPLIAVPTLHAMADALPVALKRICLCLTARKGELYMAFFLEHGGQWKADGDILTVSVSDIGSVLDGKTVYCAGEGVIKQVDLFEKLPAVRCLKAGYGYPDPWRVARLGAMALSEGRVNDADTLVPLYIKRFQGVA